MEEFINLIEDIGFVKFKSVRFTRADFLSYSYNEYIIFITIPLAHEPSILKLPSEEPKWSMLINLDEVDPKEILSFKKLCILTKEIDGVLKSEKCFPITQIDILKINFPSYFRDIKIKKLGI